MAGVFGLGKEESKSAGRLCDGWLLFIFEFPYIDDGTQSTIFRCPYSSITPFCTVLYLVHKLCTFSSQVAKFKNLLTMHNMIGFKVLVWSFSCFIFVCFL